jgi:hypothetical protein
MTSHPNDGVGAPDNGVGDSRSDDDGIIDHRTRAEDALAHAQRNPVLSAEQSFLSAQVHALLALEARLGEIVVALREVRIAAPLSDADIAEWPDLPAPVMVPPVEAER